MNTEVYICIFHFILYKVTVLEFRVFGGIFVCFIREKLEDWFLSIGNVLYFDLDSGYVVYLIML
jgi:hypothetical protein